MMLKYGLAMGLASVAVGTVVNFEHNVDGHLDVLAKAYQEKYGVEQRLSLSHKKTLFTNMQKINEHNSNPSATYTMAVNKFAHLTDAQFQQKMLMANQECSATGQSSVLPTRFDDFTEDYTGEIRAKATPKFKDWRLEGNFVTPVKNQGHCGSCWTFSSTGCLESAWAIHHGELFSLSEQQLVDCAGDFDNHGCSGGLPSHAFEYVHYNNGIDTEEGYAYTAKEEGACHYDRQKSSPLRVSGSFNITEGDEDALFQAVAYFNPVSIAYQVVKDFRFYKGGVYTSDDCKQGPMDVNHAVLVVGYGTDSDGVDYWIIKNSWGGDWGMDGYFWMKRGVNQCGIATCASFPVV